MREDPGGLTRGLKVVGLATWWAFTASIDGWVNQLCPPPRDRAWHQACKNNDVRAAKQWLNDRLGWYNVAYHQQLRRVVDG